MPVHLKVRQGCPIYSPLNKDLLVWATELNGNGLKLLNVADDLLLSSEVKHLGGNEYKVPSTVPLMCGSGVQIPNWVVTNC